MATSFVEIYDRSIAEIDDPIITQTYRESPIQFFQKMYTFMLNAIPRFNNPLLMVKVLENKTIPSGATELYDGDGITDNFILSTTPNIDSFFEYRIDDIPTVATYNSITNSVTFDVVPPDHSIVSITWYYAGQFNVTLKDTAISILSQLLVACWAEKEKNFLLDIRRLLNDTDFTLHSESTTMKGKKDWYDGIREEAEKTMNQYAWNVRFSDWLKN